MPGWKAAILRVQPTTRVRIAVPRVQPRSVSPFSMRV
jgi:hypothetical protein